MLGSCLLAIGVQLLWGLTPCASNLVIRYLPVESYAALRYTFSGLFFLLFALAGRRRFSLRGREARAVFCLGMGAYGLSSLGMLYALKLGGVLNFALGSGLGASITALVAIGVLRERMPACFSRVVALSFGGSLLILSGKYALSSLRVAGGSLLLIAAAFALEALGFAYSKVFQRRYPLSEYLSLLYFGGATLLWTVSLAMGRGPAALATMPVLAWGCLFYVALVACCFCVGTHYWLTRHLEAQRLAFFTGLQPLSAAVFGVVFFGDPFNLRMLAGGALLVLSVCLASGGKVVDEAGDREADEPGIVVQAVDEVGHG